MFDNIGSKIKTVAAVIAWIGIIASVIIGLFLMVSDDELIIVGFLVMIVGSFLSWLGSLMSYGFGQLVENSDKLVKMQTETVVEPAKKNNQKIERINLLNKWLAEGLITEEEYNKKMSELQGE